MAIKALFPHGLNSITVSGLYQWDYGQVLEIESADLGSIVAEVHFACSSMSEAIVRPCTFSAGAGTVIIPDECLEQSSTITAWIYEIAGTQGRTRKVLTIPVTGRTRPSAGHDIPTEITDKYTELITEVNEAIDALENGDVIVEKAKTSEKSDSATTAGNASTANYAVSAGSAESAREALRADEATEAYYAKCIRIDPSKNYAKIIPTEKNSEPPMQGGIVVFHIQEGESVGPSTFVMDIDRYDSPVLSPVFTLRVEEETTGSINDVFARLRLVYQKLRGAWGFVAALEIFKNDWWQSHDLTYSSYYYLSEPEQHIND